MTTLADFWPSAKACRDCLRIDADSANDAVTLAVHQPMRFLRKTLGSSQIDENLISEEELLKEFLVENPSDGLVIMPIVGNSGTGKSHIIRWFHLQLRRREDADKRLLIRVPKGRSLKGVLSDILDVVSGPQYDRYRAQVDKAQERLRPREAAGLLCELMALTLSEWAEKGISLKVSDQEKKSLEKLFATYGAPSLLPALLRNNLLRNEHWNRTEKDPGPIRRLVAQIFEDRGVHDEDDRKHLFFEDDLEIDVDLGELGREERNALGWLESDKARKDAVKALNLALDSAKHRILGLDPDVNDLFREVRRELGKEGKELVLLIEDFAVLSGLQGALLQVIIQESAPGTPNALCTMRTALAYTTGYLTAETVLTRAKREYHIPDESAEAMILQRIESLVAAYLNAARVGLPQLRQAFDDAARQPGSSALSSHRWVPRLLAPADPKEAERLEAFGYEDQIPLFPFNHAAIGVLARAGCLRDGKFVYNPRRVIVNVLQKVLDCRQDFVNRAFPTIEFEKLKRPSSTVSSWVPKKIADKPTQVRAFALLTVWGDNPQDEKKLQQFHPLVAQTFHIPWDLPGQTKVSKTTGAAGISAGTTGGTIVLESQPPPPPPLPPLASPPPPPENKLREQTRQTLEKWRDGSPMGQGFANEVRKRVAEALAGSIDWGPLLQSRPGSTAAVHPSKQLQSNLWIFNAENNPVRGNNSFILVDGDDFKDHKRSAELEQELLAVMMFHESVANKGHTWDYDGAEEDCARYGAFVRRYAPAATHWLSRRPFLMSEEWDPIPMLVAGLLLGARVLKVPDASARDHGRLMKALFEKGTAPPAGDGNSSWVNLGAALAGLRVDAANNTQIPSWQQVLTSLVGARQGDGSSVLAIDASRLQAAINAALSATEIPVSWPKDMSKTEANLLANRSLERVKTIGAADKAASAEQSRLRTWIEQIQAYLELPFEQAKKASLVESTKTFLKEAQAAGCLNESEAKAMAEQVQKFHKAPIVDTLTSTLEGAEASTIQEAIDALKLDLDPHRANIESFCKELTKLQDTIEAHLKKREEKVGADLDNALSGLTTQQELLAGVLESWSIQDPKNHAPEEAAHVAG
jgi:hypothetical protein